jgi:hypothetical protein
VLDAFADLSGHELHPLRQIPGERLGFAPGSFPQRRDVAGVGVERHRAKRND